jgi:hypothetical protein
MTIFAAIHAKNQILYLFGSSYFYGYLNAVSNDTRLSFRNGLLLTSCNLILGRTRKGSLSHFKYFNFHSKMPRINENYSSANNSNANVTSAHETCEQLPTIILPGVEKSPELDGVIERWYNWNTVKNSTPYLYKQILSEIQDYLIRSWVFDDESDDVRFKDMINGLMQIKDDLECFIPVSINN